VSKVIGVYMIEHTATGRRYVGKSVDVRRRIANHLSGSDTGCTYLRAAIRKHGREAFTASLLERCATEREATAREQHWIAKLNTRSHGFNLTDGGDGVTGHRWSDEAKARKSKLHVGRVHSEETRAKMSASRKAFFATPEGRAVLEESAAKRRGRKQSTETRARIGAANRGLRRSPEACANIRAGKQNVSDETREKIRQKSLAMSDETRERMRAARYAFLARQAEANG
jgi:group I intron endonuclease